MAAALRVAAQKNDKTLLNDAKVLAYAWIERGVACLLDDDVETCEKGAEDVDDFPLDLSTWDADLDRLDRLDEESEEEEEEEEAPAPAAPVAVGSGKKRRR